MDALEDLLIGLLVTAMVFFALGILAVWMIYRRVRRSRMLRRMTVGIQALTAPWGPARDVAVMRRDVARDVDATMRHVQQARRAGIAGSERAELIVSLTDVGRSLDAELALLARIHGRRQRDELLLVRARVADFRTQTGALRASLTDSVASTYDAKMADFAEQAERAALTAQAHRDLSRSGAGTRPAR